MNGPDKDTEAATKPEESHTTSMELPEASPENNNNNDDDVESRPEQEENKVVKEDLSAKTKQVAEQPPQGSPNRRNRTWIACVVICILFAACAILLGLYFTKENDDKQKKNSPPTDSSGPTPTQTPSTEPPSSTPPTENPFQGDAKLARLYSILEPIAPSGFYEYDAVAEEKTPEYEAWAWLSQRDMSFDTNREYTPSWKIVERYALAVFYYATNGDNWLYSFGFLSNTPVCEWKRDDGNGFDYGIRFCSSDGSVTMLYMPENNIEGNIPTYIGLMTNLTSLDLPGNLFSGSIPTEVAKLTNLKDRLDFSNNRLTGNITSSLGQLKDLTHLSLNSNRLEGTIPTEIALMTSLTSLHLSSNQLSDEIPPGVDSLSQLRELFLDDNRLSGKLPSSLGNLSSIEKLHLHQNEFTGTVPSSFSQLQNLDFHSYNLYLHGNKLSGSMEFLCTDDAFCVDNAGCKSDCVSDMECSCCFQCYATEVEACSKVSPVEQGCRIIMDDNSNMKSSMIEAKNGDTGSWHFNKDFAFQVTDKVDTDDPWTVRGWIDIEDQPIWYMPTIGVPDVNCSTMMSTDRYVMRDDSQLRFIELPDYPCTEFGKRIIYFLIMQIFYFG